MVFRIADKKRDKSVNTTSLGEIMKRLKLRISDEEINKLLAVLARKGSNIEYDDYL
jgi:Ca2+-binding EF-hand superfamily protein